MAAGEHGDCGRHDGRALDRRRRPDPRGDRARSPSAFDPGAPRVSFLLDTNILSAHLRRPAGLSHRFFQHSGRLYTSAVSLAVLYDWLNGRRNPDPLRASVQRLLTFE